MRPTQISDGEVPTFRQLAFEVGDGLAPFFFARLEERGDLPRPFPHRHSYFHLMWVTRGSGRHMIDFRDHPVRDNSIFIVVPGQIHFWAVNPETEGFVFNFSGDLFPQDSGGEPGADERLRERVYANPSFHPVGDVARTIAVITGQIEQEFTHPAPWSAQVIGSLFKVLLIQVLRIEQPMLSSPPSSFIRLAHRFRTQVEERFLDTSAIGAYAKGLGISERQLAEATKRAFGQTPKDILQDRILLEAKRLLLHSEIGVADIAFHLNFQDPAYFGRFFRRRVRMTPGEFKRRGLDGALMTA